MGAPGENLANTTEAPNVRSGRKADGHDRTPSFRFWLQAVARHIVHCVGFAPSSGHSGSGVARHAILATNGPMSASRRFRPLYPREPTFEPRRRMAAYDPGCVKTRMSQKPVEIKSNLFVYNVYYLVFRTNSYEY